MSTRYLRRVFSYIKFFIKSKPISGHGIHSPFAYKIVRNVIYDNRKQNNQELKPLFWLYDIHTKNSKYITTEIIGSKPIRKPIRVSQILKKSVSNKKKLNILFSLSKELKASNIIELGTSLGFSTLALALGNKKAHVFSIEGNAELLDCARESAKILNVTNIEFIENDFDKALQEILHRMQPPFLAYIDGNHTYKATLKYFQQLIEKCEDSQSMIIIDDIHWSVDMEKAWNEIQNHPRSIICIDFFYFGIVVYKNNTAKVNYKVRY